MLKQGRKDRKGEKIYLTLLIFLTKKVLYMMAMPDASGCYGVLEHSCLSQTANFQNYIYCFLSID